MRSRKSLLRRALTYRAHLRMPADACARGWEGLIAKPANGPYRQGRSTDWLKLKCSLGQEFVIGGFTEPAASRVGLGALLLGYHEGGRLRHAGKVGTGFDRRTLLDLRARLDELATSEPPFADHVHEARAHWVEPALVAQIAFTEWTRDGRLRHPRFLGLRDDKAARDVVHERPSELTAP